MSIILIALTAIISLMAGYYVALPFLSEMDSIHGSYLDMFSGTLKESYAQSLEDLEQLYKESIIDELEYKQQKELLLKDAFKFIKES